MVTPCLLPQSLGTFGTSRNLYGWRRRIRSLLCHHTKAGKDDMPLTLKEMMQAAQAAVPAISGADAHAKLADGALLLDVRDASELTSAGRAAGSHHISRGLLEFRADPASPMADPELRMDRVIILHCASGGRAALAGKLLKDMGYKEVYNLGGLKDWVDAGGALA